MVRYTWIAAATLALLLSACGPSGTTTDTSAVATATQEKTPQEIAAAVAQLPAPYNGADYDAGRRNFAQCRACHALDGNRVGPNLHGLFGRKAGTEPDFSYSDAVKNAGFTWDADHLDHWLSGPREYLPGNRMAFVGIRDANQRRDLIAYLMIETK